MSESAHQDTATLLENSIKPLVNNHLGGVNLHGSAASIRGRAAAFMGVSRRGKTTLAGAFARAGHPFLTEDVLALKPGRSEWQALPISTALRVFPDSARHLLTGGPSAGSAEIGKAPLADAGHLPRATEATPLGAIYLLGAGDSDTVALTPLTPSEALAGILQHAFVLDVEDRPRLASHFGRMADLASAVPCRTLDYPRRYDMLPQVISAVVDDVAQT